MKYLLVLLLLTSTVRAQEAPADTSFAVASFVFVAWSTVDLLTTTRALQVGGHEGNPISRVIIENTDTAGYVATKIVYQASILLFARSLRPKHPRLARNILFVLGALHFVCSANNVLIIRLIGRGKKYGY